MNAMVALFQDPTVQLAFWALVKIVVILMVMLGIVAYLTFFERKIAGHIQSRPGPNLVRGHLSGREQIGRDVNVGSRRSGGR